MVNAKDLDLIKCECCDNLMDREAYDAHWAHLSLSSDQCERIERMEAALLIIAATDDGMPAQIAKKVLGINKGAK